MSENPSEGDRRRIDRRTDFVSLAEYTVPELRKALATLALLIAIIGLFLYMVRDVVVGVVAGVVAAVYLLPLQARMTRRLNNEHTAAILTIVVFTVPLVAILAYSWIEISGAAAYLDAHTEEVAEGLYRGLQRIPFGDRFDIRDDLPLWVDRVARGGGEIVDELREAVDVLLIGLSVFFFTTFYVLTQHDRLVGYIRERVPGRYRDLLDPVAHNIRAVVYGVLYGTFLTQLIKSALILAMNLVWHVPLAVVLAIASFFIGLLPIVGSWTIYTPVAIYLMLWRGDIVGGVLMLLIGFLGNTMFLSMYLRPKIAAQRSRVLNFYWMFIALVTGVYTFGLVGIIIGPVLIAVLKAILDTLSLPSAAVAPEAAPETS
jgi:predicted PurR-regulated permease PerM